MTTRSNCSHADPSSGGEQQPLRVQRSPKRVRALVAGVPVLDTLQAMLVWEHPYYPTYYVPRSDLQAELLETPHRSPAVHPELGAGTVCDVQVAGQTQRKAASIFPHASTKLRGLVRVTWDAMDEWLEEDEPVYVHPRDPYKGVDILASSRHVRILVDGVTVAESRQPRILFETGLVPRYYVPMTEVRTDLLRPTDSVTRCPYKGTAGWWSLHVGDAVHRDLAWTYRTPHAEAQKIAGLVAFFDERVDMYLDGRLQVRPRTPHV